MKLTVEKTWPVCESDEQEAALRVLRSGKLNYWTGGEGKDFEREFANYHDRRFAIAVANGTLALELALHALGVGRGDEVIVPSRTFIATASSVVMRGAKPICADIDSDSQNLTAETVEPLITPRTKAIICVHLAGWPCEMDALVDLADRRGLFLIEDCAQAHGAKYRGRPVGSFGHAAAFSFCQDKIMTTGGEGGMTLFDDEIAWRRAWSYKDHGKSYNAVHEQNHRPGFRWLHKDFGTNWRMTELQAAIGRVQLRKLDGWVAQRRQNAAILSSILGKSPSLRIPGPPLNALHSYYKWYAFLQPKLLRPDWNRDRLISVINKVGVPCFSGSCGEIYLEEAFPDDWKPASRLPVASELAETSLMLLVDPTQTAAALTRYAEVVAQQLSEATTHPLRAEYGRRAG